MRKVTEVGEKDRLGRVGRANHKDTSLTGTEYMLAK